MQNEKENNTGIPMILNRRGIVRNIIVVERRVIQHGVLLSPRITHYTYRTGNGWSIGNRMFGQF